MPIAIDDVLQITYDGVLAGQTILSVLHARVSTAPSGSPTTEQFLLDLATKLGTRASMPFLDKYLAAASTSFTMRRVLVQRVKPVRSIYFEDIIGTAGDVGGGFVDTNTAISFKKRSLKVGASGVGRLQFAPWSVGDITSGYVDTAFINGVGDDLALTMFGTFTGGTTYPSAIMRWCLPGGGADHDYDIFDVSIQDTPRTMHRRTVGLGI